MGEIDRLLGEKGQFGRVQTLGLQLPSEKMVGVGWGGLTTKPEDMVGARGQYIIYII